MVASLESRIENWYKIRLLKVNSWIDDKLLTCDCPRRKHTRNENQKLAAPRVSSASQHRLTIHCRNPSIIQEAPGSIQRYLLTTPCSAEPLKALRSFCRTVFAVIPPLRTALITDSLPPLRTRREERVQFNNQQASSALC